MQTVAVAPAAVAGGQQQRALGQAGSKGRVGARQACDGRVAANCGRPAARRGGGVCGGLPREVAVWWAAAGSGCGCWRWRPRRRLQH